MSDRLEEFITRLQVELYDRYLKCEDYAATPSSILLAVVNGVNKVGRDMELGPDTVAMSSLGKKP